VRTIILVVFVSVLLMGCQKANDGIIEKTVKQCRDEVTGQFVACP